MFMLLLNVHYCLLTRVLVSRNEISLHVTFRHWFCVSPALYLSRWIWHFKHIWHQSTDIILSHKTYFENGIWASKEHVVFCVYRHNRHKADISCHIYFLPKLTYITYTVYCCWLTMVTCSSWIVKKMHLLSTNIISS